MSVKTYSEEELNSLAVRILSLRKYKALSIPKETVMALVSQEAALGRGSRETEKAVREKLHQIIAPYLGDPDYAAEELALQLAAAQGQTAIDEWCLHILNVHDSSRERIPVMTEFYQRIFSLIGTPYSILDLACAFDPFSFPWMELPKSTLFYAFDLVAPRVHLLNSYFSANGMQPLAVVQDILLEPPAIKADVAFFFKEAHRFESRSKGCNKRFWQSLNVGHIVVTLPAENLTGQHQMRERQRSLIAKNTEGCGWNVKEFEVSGEMVFIIEK